MRLLIPIILVIACAGGARAQDARPPYERALTGDDLREAQTLAGLMDTEFRAGRWAEAARLAAALRDLRRNRQGADHWEAALAESLRAEAAWGRDASPEQARLAARFEALLAEADDAGDGRAEALLAEAVALCREFRPRVPNRESRALENLAKRRAALGRLREADAAVRERLAVLRDIGCPNESPFVAQAVWWQSELAARLGDWSGAAERAAESLRLRGRVVPPGDPVLLDHEAAVAAILVQLGRYAEAEGQFARVLEARSAKALAGASGVRDARLGLASALSMSGRFGDVVASCAR